MNHGETPTRDENTMHGDVMQAMLERALMFALDTVQMVADGDLDAEETQLPDSLAGLTSEQATELREYASAFLGWSL